MDPDDPRSTGDRSKSSDVVTGDHSVLQQEVTPDPRWPYLGRWSSKPNSVSPPLMSVEEKELRSPSATVTLPPETEAPPPATIINSSSPETEDHVPPTPPPPVPASTNPSPKLGENGELAVSEKDELADEQAKETVFV